MIERGREYRKLGRKAWLHQLARKARQGFEHHPNKCYRVLVLRSEEASLLRRVASAGAFKESASKARSVRRGGPRKPRPSR